MKYLKAILAATLLTVPYLSANAQQPKGKTVPLSAEIHIVNTRTLTNGSSLKHETTVKYFRREDGSTRMEEPGRTIILDKTAGTFTVLFADSKIAQVQKIQPVSASATQPAFLRSLATSRTSSAKTTDSEPSIDLGEKVIDGHTVRGSQKSQTIPANSGLGNSDPITKTVQSWRSSELSLPILTVISDPVGGTTTSQYQNISTQENDPSLFAIPSGYRVVYGDQSKSVPLGLSK